MTAPIRPGVERGTAGEQQALRKVAAQLEGVFYAQLFQAMRAAVPESGMTEASSAEKTFTAMFDERVAEMAAGRSDRGLAEAMYRQLSQHLQPAGAPAAVPGAGEIRGNDG